MANFHLQAKLVTTILIILVTIVSFTTAIVPPNATFKFVNEGFFGEYIDLEYDATYRFMPDVFAGPFAICFYNSTPDVFTLAVRMGGTFHRRTTLRWVWEANRGKPVGENAVFALGTDGNLVLSHANGRIVWQSNTANKGVVGFKLLPNGNMVLHDAKGAFVWQSFDSPTDTLLVGQSLRIKGGVNKLVSRLSEKENKPGPYSLIVEEKGSMSLYYKSKNTPTPLLYYTSPEFTGIPNEIKLEFALDAEAGAYFFTFNAFLTARAYHNSTLSFLRLTIDGNIEIITYNPDIERRAFVLAYAFFNRDIPRAEIECQLPERCGSFGVCDQASQCVACPSERGLLGWSEECEPPKLSSTSCKGSGFHYYKIKGVDHFLSKYTSGEAIKESECGKKCSLDCKCLGYFYNRDISSCWVAFELKTLTKSVNSTHLGYIKTPNK